ncbi:C45 family peptidase [Agrococcus sp. ARC_14]|uniref:C45 family autoproteolytic acyltransferase/hydolase n=1 Tax=Agrococcus sp. ARC_14 TaxID=2919927 RepID=UPI001F057E19|nr:C45 family peptidase [Agrococcus sp. ARC_14]MCH1881810.1 C45 family peptidase [Agrococcus sp. ARC_14]
MRVTELRLTDASAHARGVAYGAALGGEVRHTIGLYREAYELMGVPADVIDEVVAGSLDAVRDWAPTQWEELTGLAEGTGVRLDELMLLTARTEILAHAPVDVLECSTVVALHEDRRPQTMQTWDWHGELAPTGVLLELHLPGADGAGRVVRTFAETGMVGKIGVTAGADGSGGLGVHFNILHHASDRTAVGVPVHVVMRRILDEASSVDGAIALARSATVGASTVLTVVQGASAGAPARAASLELAPAGVAVVEAKEGFLAHTNHFLDPQLAEGEATLDSSTTGPRFEHTVAQRASIEGATDAVSMAAAMCGEAGADAPVCVRVRPAASLAERWETLLTASLDVEAAAIDWFAGPPSGLDASTVRRFG